MRFSILGPLEVRDTGGAVVTVGGARLRRLLVLLLVTPGSPVGTDRLIDGIWGENAPAATGNALQALVSRLRRVLGDRVSVLGGTMGYRLDVPPAHVDMCEFKELVARGRRARVDGDLRGAGHLFREALALWRGPALVDLTEVGCMEDIALRLTEERRSVATERLALQLDTGSHAEALPEIEELVAREPLDERPVELLMRALTASGRQADALSAYDRLRRALAGELGIDPSAQLQELHLSLLRGELRIPSPALAPGRAKPSAVRLPPTLTSFIAREDEIRDAVGLVRDTRLVTLIGPGGAGKTRLSIEAGARFAEQYPSLAEDGVRFVELAPVSDGADIAHTVLTALGVQERSVMELHTGASAASAPGDAVERVIDSLTHQRLLLILDNCEHLITEVSRLAERLLGSCPGLRILATSREPLAAAGERLLEVSSLELPPEGTLAERVGEYASVRLFVERSSAVQPGFAVDEGNAEHIVRICRELDGMPLALELAAARIRALPVSQLAARLCDRFRLLTSGNRSALPRHQTLQAVVDWSWDLLNEAERTLMRRLSVFAGGATLEAVEPVRQAMLSRVAVQTGDRAEARRRAAAAWRGLGTRQGVGQIAHVLEQLAEVALVENADRAAALLGYAEAIRGLPDETDPDIVRIRERARQSLGEAAFAQAYAAGATSTRDEILSTFDAWVVEWEART